MRPRRTETEIPAIALYAMILALSLAASFFPHLRLWGSGPAAFLPLIVRIGLTIVGLAPVVWLYLQPQSRNIKEASSGLAFLPLTGLITLVFGTLFFLLPANTFFLGDGLQNLDTMAAGNTIVKLTSWGEGMIRSTVASALQVTGRSGALSVYRLIAGISGIVLILFASAAASGLFRDNRDRLLFTLGIATGGYGLLFFGYVEQYSIFVVAVAAFVLIGLLIASHRLGRWWILPLFMIAVTLHELGIVLLPAALYLLMADTRFGRRLRKAGATTRLLLVLAALAMVVAAGAVAFRLSLFLRYAFIPVVDGLFAYDHYTLLSPSHFIDFVNLVFLLFPGFLLLLLLVIRKDRRGGLRERPAVFLITLIWSAFGGLFWIDPKLGMPRDWDLFSFAGVPLVALFYWLALSQPESHRRFGRTVAVLGIALGIMWLVPRVAVLRLADAAIAQHKAYLALDPERGLRAYSLTRTYYMEQGDSTSAARATEEWHRLYPERDVFFRGIALADAGHFTDARQEFRRAVIMNSTYADAWSYLGESYMKGGELDSADACFWRSLRLNPYEPAVWNNLGTINVRRQRYDRARTYYLKAHDLLGENAANLYNLATVARLAGHADQYVLWLERAARSSDAVAGVHKELANYYVTIGKLKSAAAQYRFGLAKGLDTAFVREVIRRHPSLAPLVPLEPLEPLPDSTYSD